MNLRPSGYEPDELPGCSTPRRKGNRTSPIPAFLGRGFAGGGLAATYSSASIEAVPWALRVFTAEFGMGSGVFPLAMATRPALGFRTDGFGRPGISRGSREESCGRCLGLALGFDPRRRSPAKRPFAGLPGEEKRFRAISTGWLKGLLRFHFRPIDVMISHGSRGDLVLRRVSRLDAFSGYPFRT